MRMNGYSRGEGRATRLGALICVVAAIALIGLALLTRGPKSEPDWKPVNGEVENALASLESDNQPEAEKQGTGDLQSDDKGKGNQDEPSGQGGVADAGEKGDGGAAADGAKGDGTGAGEGASGDEKGDGTGADEKGDGGAAGAGSTGGPTTSQGQIAGDTAGGTAVPGAAGRDDSERGKIDVNRATAAELDALPGIGAAKAAAIVAERERGGIFKREEDLLRVKGIGPKLLEKMKSFIVLGP